MDVTEEELTELAMEFWDTVEIYYYEDGTERYWFSSSTGDSVLWHQIYGLWARYMRKYAMPNKLFFTTEVE